MFYESVSFSLTCSVMRYRRRSITHNCAVWREGREEQFLMGHLTVERFKRGWMRRPDYALVSGEPDA
jgi:hypothetical protein